ncbi:MAG: hypothetical protein AAF485_23140 [Chloroflexota bacterium]
MSIHDLLNKMESAEDEFMQSEFLAPVLPNGQVRVRIAGLVCTLQVAGRVKPGWAILKPQTMNRARIIARASLRQIRDYLALFPSVRLLLLTRAKTPWLALPANQGDRRFQITTPIPLYLSENVQPFQQIVARFDGGHFWFEAVDRRRNPAVGAYLRQSLNEEIAPEELRKSTLTPEEREAYQLAHTALQEARRDQVEVRLADALGHAGAQLSAYIEREDGYTVAFSVDGQTYRSTVAKDDLTLLTAGICLNGQDRRFDLHSLVGVIREGAERDYLNFVGDDTGLDEDLYWQIHPEDS